MSSPYVPAFRTQRVKADPNASVNCAAYSVAMLLDRETLGGINITGRRARALSNEPTPNPSSPGLNLGQIEHVARKLGTRIHVVVGQDAGDLNRALQAGHAVCLPGVYGKLPRELRHSSTFTGDHMIYLDSGPVGDGKVRAGDPLGSTFTVWPWAAAVAFWRAYGDAFLVGRPITAHRA